jgi:predicted metal-dependent peptidase
MSSSDIAYVINEIFNIVKDYDSKITIIECDAEIGKVYEAKKASDVQTRVTGRGGTSFVPVIEYINKTNKYKNALMIYFTDGYGDNEIPRPRTFRNLWVVLQDEKYLSLKEPYGEVKALRKDADWIKMNEGN